MSEARTLLHGLQPQPVASYLGALGILRISCTQHDRRVRGSFERQGFVIEGLTRSELTELLLERYSPTSVFSPWNNASGFYTSSKGRLAASALEALMTSKNPRFDKLVQTAAQIQSMIRELGYVDAPEGTEKALFIQRLRGILSDDALAWLDAVAVIENDEARMMPLLGSGGNEGVLEYSGLFLRSIVDTMVDDRERSARLLAAALYSEISNELLERPGGQFEPGTAGGFNTGPGFESKSLPNNPWNFLLLVEGSLVWTSTIASRQIGMESGYRFAVSPFTVRHRAAGYSSAGKRDDDPQRTRAEIWVPVWRRPANLAEVERFIGEGRVEVRGHGGSTRRATDSVDFADAVGSLGVDRGVDSFVRYTFIKRRGDSFIALPTAVLDVRVRREIDLLRQLDDDLANLDSFLRRFPGDGPPAQLVARRRAIDECRLDVAQRGGTDAMSALVRAIGSLEMALSRRDPGKEPRLARSLGRLGPDWIDACGESIEVRIAAAVTSLARIGGAAPLRAYLSPIDPDEPWRYAIGARTLAWEGRDLADRLANVLGKRFRDARMLSSAASKSARNPTFGPRRATLFDIGTFIEGDVDERALEELIFGFTWLKDARGRARAASPHIAPPLPRAYSMLRLLFRPDGIPTAAERIHLIPDGSIVPLLRTGRVSDAVDVARRQLMSRGLHPRRVIDPGVRDPVLGRRIAAALMIPVSATRRLVADALLPDRDPISFDHEETADDR
jgi:CRISPR-associated protein Csx17